MHINGLKLIKYVNEKCNIGITIGIANNIIDADQAQSTAKKYNNRGIIAMYWFNWPNIHLINDFTKYKKISFVAKNENDVKIIHEQVYNQLLPTDDKDTVNVKSFEIWEEKENDDHDDYE